MAKPAEREREGVLEVPYDQRNGVGRRLSWWREVHLRRSTGPRQVADHLSEPGGAG